MAKENVIKTKIALDGEKEYKQACRSIDLSLKELGSEMKLVTAEYAENAKSTDALKAKQSVLKRQFDEQSRKVREVEEALRKMRESGVDETSAAYVRMRTNLNNAKAEMAKTQSQIKDTTGALKENKVKWEDVGSAIAKTTEKIGKAVAAFGAVATGIATALSAATVSAGAYADEILTISANTHIATDDLQKYQYALNFIDGDIDTLTKTLKKNTQQMDAARDGNKELMGTYDALGIAITDSNGELRNAQDVYWEVIDALGQVENMTERDALAMQLLGKSGTELNTIIDAGSKEFKKLGDEAEKMGVVMGEESLNKLGAFDDKVQQLKAGLGGLKNAMGFIALPLLDTLANEGIPILAEFSKGIQDAEGDILKMGDVFGDGVSDVISLIIKELPKFVGFGGKMIESVVSGLTKNIGQISTSGLKVIGMLLNGLKTMLPQLINAGGTMIKELGKGLRESLPELVPLAVSIVTEVVKSIIENLPLVIDAGLDVIEGFVEGIIDAIPVLIEALPEIITSIVDTLLSSIPKIIDAGIRLLTSLIDNMPLILDTIIEAMPKIIDGIVTGLTDNIDKIIDAGVDLIIALVTNLPKALGTLVDKGPEIVQAVVDGIVKAFGKLFEVGEKIVRRIWEGIENMMKWLEDLFFGWIRGLVDWAKNMFDGIAKDVEERRNAHGQGRRAAMERMGKITRKDEGDGATNVNVTQNIYANNTSYSAQQKEAAKHIKNTVRGLWK